MATRFDNLSKRTAYFWGYKLSIPPDVYEPAEDTEVLARTLSSLANRLRGIVLDMGCGSGALTILLAQRAEKVVAVDINPRASAATVENCRRYGVEDRVGVVCGDLLTAFAKKEVFDAAVFNPPYLPVVDEEVDRRAYAWWSGGRCGVEVATRFVKSVWPLLKPGGVVVLVASSLSDVAGLVEEMVSTGYFVKEVCREKLFFEELVVLLGEK